MPHELDAGLIGEQVPQQALEQRRDPRERLADEGHRELERQQLDEPPPVHRAAGPATPIARTTSSTISLPIQSTTSGTSERATRSTRMAGHVARLASVHTSRSSRGHVLQRFDAFAPPGPGLVRLSAPTVRPYDWMPKRQRH